MFKRVLLAYCAPELDLYEVKVEHGFQNSPGEGGGTQLPGFGSEEGDLVY